jgi:hypothetical protein
MASRVALPLGIYGVTAILCWLTPSRLMVDDETSVINIFPTKALGLATVALAIVHWALALRGRLVVGVAGFWAVATTWMTTMFAVSHLLPPFTWLAIRLVHILTAGGTACALSVLAWQLVRRRLAPRVHLIPRGFVVLGVAALAFNYAVLALREVGVLAAPVGLEQMAGVVAGLTVDLWINSAILFLGAVSHAVSSRLRSQPKAV